MAIIVIAFSVAEVDREMKTTGRVCPELSY